MTSDSRHWLVVDLDKTLIRTDLLKEKWMGLLLRQPWQALRVLAHLRHGKPALKRALASVVALRPETLPYRAEVLARIRVAKENGRPVALISASHAPWVREIAEHLGLFDCVEGTEPELNMKGASKIAVIRAKCTTGPFEYLGDAWADVPIWREGGSGAAIDPGFFLRRHLRSGPVEIVRGKSSWRASLRLMRPHQWIKNVLTLTAPFAAHTFFRPATLFDTLISFVGFSAMASAVYVINDGMDIEADRRHPSKRFRPLASGEVTPLTGLLLAGACFTGALIVAGFAEGGAELRALLLLYFAGNLAYSLWLKRMLAVDLIFLSLMYTMRIFAGALATSTPVSNWLLSFSTFIFFGLAALKRLIELDRTGTSTRAYGPSDRLPLMILGIASTFCSLLIIMLYFNSPEVRLLYRYPDRLWALMPLALYSLSRIWILFSRGELHDDPVVYALTDYRQHAVVVLGALVLWSAM